ncbi:hypothetical protein [Bradyrhizobium sp. WSM4349]|uniref:hypothetical protein n=1 Tax=Bradyrhizobium sp. WSM4349 TaxID=1040988 RepID=UPI000A07BAF4|nr:hypothetical protein [Bradyrhizobium sp. WSM4349]
MRSAEACAWRVLTPYDPREGISLAVAAKRAGKSETTVRNWCPQHGLGRRVGGGVWVVSQVALAMFLDGDAPALAAYHTGDRSSALVVQYFERVGVPAQKPSAYRGTAEVKDRLSERRF